MINGYQLTTPLSNVDAGFCKWGFAEKNGIQYFIKEFLKPKYPTDPSLFSPRQYQRILKICKEYEERRSRFFEALNECMTGNVVTTSDFFRYKSRYYLTTEKIDAASISVEEIASLDMEKKGIIAKVLVDSVKQLHENDIVHGDLKPTNVLIKHTKGGYYTAKLIDFDNSFFEHEAPKAGEEINGDMVYFAPEAILHINGEDVEITRKIDVFAIGILFHQYFAGSLPRFDTSKNSYISGAVLSGDEIVLAGKLPDKLQALIRKMLAKEPDERPFLNEVFEQLNEIISGKSPESKKVSADLGKPVLKVRKKCDSCGNTYSAVKYSCGSIIGECDCSSKVVKKSAFTKAGDL
jgi:serine/threonine protein kinase